MNLFVGIGKIVDAYERERVLKFTFSIQQEKPCNVPCLIFDPDNEIKSLFLMQGKNSKWFGCKVDFQATIMSLSNQKILDLFNFL